MYKTLLSVFITLLMLSGQLAGAVTTDFDKGLGYMRDGNYAKAFCLWEPLARLGHPDAQYNLGWLYANGNGLNVDVKSAVYWWQQAANNGYLDAQFAIGLAYTTGEGIKSDLDQAFKWFLLAAKSGHEDSQDIVKRLVLESGKDYYVTHPELYSISWLQQNIVVSGDVVNVRDEPGSKGKIIYKAKKGEIFKKTAKKGDWVGIQLPSESQNGWIYGKLVKESKNTQ